MKVILHTNPKMVVSDEGKLLREINDIKTTDHTPNYSSVIFLANNITTEDEVKNLYVEEPINEEQ